MMGKTERLLAEKGNREITKAGTTGRLRGGLGGARRGA